MQIGQKFSIAVHILLSVEFFKEDKNTSEFLAEGIGVNPVIIRNITALLKKAKLIKTSPGVGGLSLLKQPSEITLLDIYNAVNSDQKELFKIHQKSPAACPLGGQIQNLLSRHFLAAQNAMQNKLSCINLQNLLDELRVLGS